MLLKLKDSPSLRWMLKRKLNFELRVKTVSYFKIVFCNLKCLLIKDTVDFKDRILEDCWQEWEHLSWVVVLAWPMGLGVKLE
jgi:hypothetical protein